MLVGEEVVVETPGGGLVGIAGLGRESCPKPEIITTLLFTVALKVLTVFCAAFPSSRAV